MECFINSRILIKLKWQKNNNRIDIISLGDCTKNLLKINLESIT